jgi:hypothetical protein
VVNLIIKKTNIAINGWDKPSKIGGLLLGLSDVEISPKHNGFIGGRITPDSAP